MKRIIPTLLSVLLSVGLHAAELLDKEELADSLGVLYHARRVSKVPARSLKDILPKSPLIVIGQSFDLEDLVIRRQVDLVALKVFFEKNSVDTATKQALLEDIKTCRSYAPLTEQERKALMNTQAAL